MIKFKAGDKVKITLGKDKGREGQIERIFPDKKMALVPGLNIYKKHLKGMPNQKGGIYDIPKPFDFSKIALICPKCGKTTRVAFKILKGSGEKIRICAKCNKEIDTGKGGKAKK